MTGPEPIRRRLLLVSDDVASAEALRAHLTRHGFLLCEANSARMAALAAREVRPDVVLIDAAIHGGWQAVIRELDGVIPRARVSVLAAYWSNDARRLAEDVGIGAILLKQMEGDLLAERLRGVGEGGASVRATRLLPRPVAPGAAR
jgi:DNA-binding NarL/FixJ family response regulator